MYSMVISDTCSCGLFRSWLQHIQLCQQHPGIQRNCDICLSSLAPSHSALLLMTDNHVDVFVCAYARVLAGEGALSGASVASMEHEAHCKAGLLGTYGYAQGNQ